jgi:hypothetical protein
LTLQELTDNLASVQFPVVTVRLWAAFGFIRREPGILIANRVEIANDVGSVLGTYDFPDVVFPADQPVQRVLAPLAGTIWPAPGTYLIRFSSRGIVLAAFPFFVLQVTMPAPLDARTTEEGASSRSTPTTG